MIATNDRPTDVGSGHARRVHTATDGAETSKIRARVRAMIEAHAGLVGVSWRGQAEHAEAAVAEVIDLQGLEAARRWASTLAGELRAERRAAGVDDPRATADLAVGDGHDWFGGRGRRD